MLICFLITQKNYNNICKILNKLLMIMNKINLDKELEVAKKAAYIAGKLLLGEDGNLKKELLSTDRDLKLNADVMAEKKIIDIISKESNYPILAEESGLSSEMPSDIFWVIDPLDGTANYSKGIPISCVSIALIFKLNPILGIIYDFNNDDLYEGSINSYAMLNNKKISVSDIDTSNKGVLLTGMPNDSDFSEKALNNMILNFQNWRKVRMIGSAAMASAYVASGKADAYSETKTYLWDVAAGAAVVNAAGGKAIISNQNNKYQVDVFFTNSSLSI
jgi:myo-inositol-1(or 4)-monophosphatase